MRACLLVICSIVHVDTSTTLNKEWQVEGVAGGGVAGGGVAGGGSGRWRDLSEQ